MGTFIGFNLYNLFLGGGKSERVNKKGRGWHGDSKGHAKAGRLGGLVKKKKW